MPLPGRPVPLIAYLVAFAFAMAVPLASYAVYATVAFSKAEQLRLEQEGRHLVHDLLRKIDREHASQVAVLEALATSPSLEANDLSAFDRQAKKLAAKGGYQIALIGSDGAYLTNTRYDFGAANLPRTSQIFEHHHVQMFDKPSIVGLFSGTRTARPLTATVIPLETNYTKTTLMASLSSLQNFKHCSMSSRLKRLTMRRFSIRITGSSLDLRRLKHTSAWNRPGITRALDRWAVGKGPIFRAYRSSPSMRSRNCLVGASTSRLIGQPLPPRSTVASEKWA